MSQNIKAKIKNLGNHFEDKKSRDELYLLINEWLHRKKNSECNI